MIDFGFDKLAIIGAVALIVIGPEKLPRVARTVGALLGKAQRYVADVKAEVNRSIELEELQKMKKQFETAARDVQDNVTRVVEDTRSSIEERARALEAEFKGEAAAMKPLGAGDAWPPDLPAAAYRPPRKNWRLKRSAVPRPARPARRPTTTTTSRRRGSSATRPSSRRP